MSQKLNDNILTLSAQPLDARYQKLVDGISVPYASKSEATSLIGEWVHENLKVQILIETSEDFFQSIEHKWNGSEWIVFDPIQINNDTIPTPSDETFIIV